jgi:hypothetical protein
MRMIGTCRVGAGGELTAIVVLRATSTWRPATRVPPRPRDDDLL